MKSPGCTLCNEISKQKEGNLCYELFNRQVNRVIAQTKNFVVLPTIGQIVEGYLLIVPKKHYFCIGAIPSNYLQEFIMLKKECKRILLEIYGTGTIFFEHGSVDVEITCRAGCCIDHAHLHVVPVDLDLHNKISQKYKEVKISKISELQRYHKSKRAYLYYENCDGQKYVFDAPVVVSQFLRMILAEELGSPDLWDWRKHPGKQKMLNTITKLRGRFCER